MRSLSEITLELEDKTDSEKVKILQGLPPGHLKAIKLLLRFAYEKVLIMDLPKVLPEWKSTRADDPSSMFGIDRVLNYMVPPLSDKMTEKKRVNLFIDLIESLTPSDADLLLAVKDKKFPNVSKSVALKAFPGFMN
jgi:hypothetical protein